MHDFSTDAAGVAMLASSYFWGYTLMQIPAGLLVDRYGVKRVVLVSMAASSLGSAAFALAPNLLDVFAARADRCLRRRPGLHRAVEACRAEFQPTNGSA